MTSFGKGRVCRKNSGRDYGKKCVIMDEVDDIYVELLCQGRKKRRRCNKRHLDLIDEVIEVGSDEETLKQLG